MRHYPAEVDATVRWFQVGALVLVAAGFLGILTFDATRNNVFARAPFEVPPSVMAP